MHRTLADEAASLEWLSHELRNPLTAICGYVELLLAEDAGPSTERQRAFLQVIDRSAGRMCDVLNSCTDLKRSGE